MNTARVIQEEPEVNGPVGGISTDYITTKYGIHHFDPSVDKLAKKCWMPKGLRTRNAALGTGGSTKATAKPAKKVKLHVVPKPEISEPGQPAIVGS